MTDPIADYLTRIRNAVNAGHKIVVPLANSGRCGKSPHHWTHRHPPRMWGESSGSGTETRPLRVKAMMPRG